MKHVAIQKIEVPYILSVSGGCIYYTTLGIALGLLLVRSNHSLWAAIPFIGKYPLYQNISNFTISYSFLMTFGLSRLYQPHAWRSILIGAGVLVFLNVFMETFVTFINTRDWRDAVAGAVGIIVGLFFLAMIQRYFTRLK